VKAVIHDISSAVMHHFSLFRSLSLSFSLTQTHKLANSERRRLLHMTFHVPQSTHLFLFLFLFLFLLLSLAFSILLTHMNSRTQSGKDCYKRRFKCRNAPLSLSFSLTQSHANSHELRAAKTVIRDVSSAAEHLSPSLSLSSFLFLSRSQSLSHTPAHRRTSSEQQRLFHDVSSAAKQRARGLQRTTFSLTHTHRHTHAHANAMTRSGEDCCIIMFHVLQCTFFSLFLCHELRAAKTEVHDISSATQHLSLSLFFSLSLSFSFFLFHVTHKLTNSQIHKLINPQTHKFRAAKTVVSSRFKCRNLFVFLSVSFTFFLSFPLSSSLLLSFPLISSLFLSPSLPLFFSLFLSLFLSLSISFTLFLSLSVSFSLNPSLSFSFSLFPSHTNT